MHVCVAGRYHGVDTAERPNMGGGQMAVVNCLKAREINTSVMVSVATDGPSSMRGAEGVWDFTAEVTGSKTAYNSLHLVTRSIVHSPEYMVVLTLVIQIVNKIMAKDLNH